ncbi:hypothetical protein AAFF_G00385330 [Aldrovandia affinis]|uniref:Uncharacterized protein n=1 Tax=Aldrovandia affinis TaxID=143900 RepID=A0AAD7SFD3_9TELE|nr:hypothetical protein AAFF_G00385330 [Aldrovandia affinis]
MGGGGGAFGRYRKTRFSLGPGKPKTNARSGRGRRGGDPIARRPRHAGPKAAPERASASRSDRTAGPRSLPGSVRPGDPAGAARGQKQLIEIEPRAVGGGAVIAAGAWWNSLGGDSWGRGTGPFGAIHATCTLAGRRYVPGPASARELSDPLSRSLRLIGADQSGAASDLGVCSTQTR